MLSIQGMTYVKSAKILIANLVQVKSGHQTSILTHSPSGAVRVEQRFPRFAGFRIAKQPTFPRNKFGMSETSCWIRLFSKFVKFHLFKSGNRQEITRKHNVVRGAKLSLINDGKSARKSQPHACADVFQLCPMRFFWTFARLSPRLAQRVNNQQG